MSVEGADFSSTALGAAARDLTAPLVLLRQLSFQLDGQLSDTSGDSTGQVLERLRLTVGHTLKISEQLRLALSEAEQLPLEPVQLNGLCCEVVREAQLFGRHFDCRVDCELPRRTPVAVGNYQALRLMLLGFLTDAVRYSDSGDIQNRGRIVRLRVSGCRKGRVLLEVRDDGPSFNLAQSLRFAKDPASNNPTINRPLMGSLNLLLADRLMQAMNGDLAVSRRRRGGTILRASLESSRQLSLVGGL